MGVPKSLRHLQPADWISREFQFTAGARCVQRRRFEMLVRKNDQLVEKALSESQNEVSAYCKR